MIPEGDSILFCWWDDNTDNNNDNGPFVFPFLPCQMGMGSEEEKQQKVPLFYKMNYVMQSLSNVLILIELRFIQIQGK